MEIGQCPVCGTTGELYEQCPNKKCGKDDDKGRWQSTARATPIACDRCGTNEFRPEWAGGGFTVRLQDGKKNIICFRCERR
jgi:hypothetical protein